MNNFLDKEVEGALGPASQTLLEFLNSALTPNERSEEECSEDLCGLILEALKTPSNLLQSALVSCFLDI